MDGDLEMPIFLPTGLAWDAVVAAALLQREEIATLLPPAPGPEAAAPRMLATD